MRRVAANTDLSMEGRWYRKFNSALRFWEVPGLVQGEVSSKVRHPILDKVELYSEVFKSAEGDEDAYGGS